jgi:hypothetical protein
MGEWYAKTEHDHAYEVVGFLILPSIALLLTALWRVFAGFTQRAGGRKPVLGLVTSIIRIALLALWLLYSA